MFSHVLFDYLRPSAFCFTVSLLSCIRICSLIRDTLGDLVSFVIIKKRDNTQEGVLLLVVTLLLACFSRFQNYTIGIKSYKLSHIKVIFFLLSCKPHFDPAFLTLIIVFRSCLNTKDRCQILKQIQAN